MPLRIEPSFRAALADFDAIYDYIARDNPRAAAQALRSLDRSIQLLADQPKLGKAAVGTSLTFLTSCDGSRPRSTYRTGGRVARARNLRLIFIRYLAPLQWPLFL
jgi:plasmid stabilization system protein ParE